MSREVENYRLLETVDNTTSYYCSMKLYMPFHLVSVSMTLNDHNAPETHNA